LLFLFGQLVPLYTAAGKVDFQTNLGVFYLDGVPGFLEVDYDKVGGGRAVRVECS
jgi:hypothetical protein